MSSSTEAPKHLQEHDSNGEQIEDLEVYRLDYETQPIAAGGEALQNGDHVYMWCTLYQHHGIVVDTNGWQNKNEGSELQRQFIVIAEFTNLALAGANTIINSSSTASGAVSNGVSGGFRFVQETAPETWHKVRYNANPLECTTWRPGTCSGATPSTTRTILARVQFLRDCRYLIPNYHLLASNCETVAVWCVTGKWETLQANRAMQMSNLGALATAAAAGPVVGLAAGALSIWHSIHVGQKKEGTAEILNREFQWYAMGRTPEIVLDQDKREDYSGMSF